MRGLLALLFCCLVGCGEPVHTVSAVGMRAFEVSLGDVPDRLTLLWDGGAPGIHAIHLLNLDATGRPVGEPVALTGAGREAYEPDVDALDADFVIAWYEHAVTDPPDRTVAIVARVDPHGRIRWRRDLPSNGLPGRGPVVRAQGGEIHVAWLVDESAGMSSIWAVTYSPDGEPLTTARAVAPATRQTWNLNAVLSARGFLVVYDAQLDTRAKELHLVRVHGDTIGVSRLSRDDGYDSVYPDIALRGDLAALTWFDNRDGNDEVYLSRPAPLDSGIHVDDEAIRITSSPGPSFGAYVAWSGDRIGLAYCDMLADRQVVVMRTFDVDGRPVGPPRQYATPGLRASIPAIRAWRRGFALAWNEYRTSPQAAGPDTVSESVARVTVID